MRKEHYSHLKKIISLCLAAILFVSFTFTSCSPKDNDDSSSKSSSSRAKDKGDKTSSSDSEDSSSSDLSDILDDDFEDDDGDSSRSGSKSGRSGSSNTSGSKNADVPSIDSKNGITIYGMEYIELFDKQEAYAYFGDKLLTNKMAVKTSTGDNMRSTIIDNKRGWQVIYDKDPLSFKVADDFLKDASNKDISLTLEFYSDKDSEIIINYRATGGKTKEIIIPMKADLRWGAYMVRISDANFDKGLSGNDITLNLGEDLSQIRLAAVRIKKIDKVPTQKGGVTVMSDQINNFPMIVKTKYATTDVVMSNVNVKYFGAVGDGVVNDTTAFEMALEYVGNLGGGTVFVPEGKYVITRALTLPVNVTLRGDSEMPNGGAVKGTILMAYPGRNTVDTPAFITMSSDSAVKNLAVWYPEQTLSNGKAIPFPYTFDDYAENTSQTIENIVMVNSYRGISFGPDANSCQTVRNVVGTPLKQGMYMNFSADITRYENIKFNADVWLKSGLGAPDKAKLSSWLINNATGFLYERIDWAYFSDISIDGYLVGLLSRRSTTQGDGTASGEGYNINITNCNTCLYAQEVNEVGFFFTNSTFTAAGGSNPVAIKLTGKFNSSIHFNNCIIKSAGKNAVTNSGSGVVELMNCNVSMSDSSAEAAISLTATGKLSATTTIFSGGGQHINLGEDVVCANLTNCMTKATLKIKAAQSSIVNQVYDTSPKPLTAPTNFDYGKLLTTKPGIIQMVNISDAPYNIKPASQPGGGSDISVTLQKAIDDMAAAGGGLVYVPAGTYRLDKAVTVKKGVELRGASDSALHPLAMVTTFFTDYGHGSNDLYNSGTADATKLQEKSTALFTMQEKSGISGFNVFYDKQTVIENEIVAFPYTIRGAGSDIYIVNVTLTNAFNGVDMETNRCDRHYIFALNGVTLNKGIVIGAGSTDGRVRDCHFNPMFWLSNPYADLERFAAKLGKPDNFVHWALNDHVWPYSLKHTYQFVVGKSYNEIMFNNFVYGSHIGLHFKDGAEVYSLSNSIDGTARSMVVEDITTAKPTYVVASQLVVSGGHANDAYIKTTDKFKGELNLISTILFGIPYVSCSFEGEGKVRLLSASIQKSTQNLKIPGFQLRVKYSEIAGVFFEDKKPSCDMLISSEIDKAWVYGNVFNRNPKIIDNKAGAKAVGGDMN